MLITTKADLTAKPILIYINHYERKINMSIFEYLVYFGFSFLFLLNIYLTLFLKVLRKRAFADKFALTAFIVGLAATAFTCIYLPFALWADEPSTQFLLTSYFTALLNSITLSIQLIYCFDKNRRGAKKC